MDKCCTRAENSLKDLILSIPVLQLLGTKIVNQKLPWKNTIFGMFPVDEFNGSKGIQLQINKMQNALMRVPADMRKTSERKMIYTTLSMPSAITPVPAGADKIAN